MEYRRKCAELLVTITLEDLGGLHMNAASTPRPQSVPPVRYFRVTISRVAFSVGGEANYVAR